MTGPVSTAVLAHGAAAGTALPETVLLVGAAGLTAAGYLRGVARLRAGNPATPWARRRWAFLAGLAVLVAVLFPPLEPVVAGSFPAHMAQHMALLLVAAPLLALGAPGLPLLLALPRRERQRVAALRGRLPARRLRAAATLPAVVVVAHAAVVLAWHLPSLYTAALASEAVHVTEHAALLAVGWWFWALVTAPAAPLDGRAVLAVAATGLPMNLVGAVLTFAPAPLYPAQTGTGPGALAEQQIAGLLMWVPAGAVYLALCALLMLLWLRRLDRETPGTAPLPPPVFPVPTAEGTR